MTWRGNLIEKCDVVIEVIQREVKWVGEVQTFFFCEETKPVIMVESARFESNSSTVSYLLIFMMVRKCQWEKLQRSEKAVCDVLIQRLDVMTLSPLFITDSKLITNNWLVPWVFPKTCLALQGCFNDFTSPLINKGTCIACLSISN